MRPADFSLLAGIDQILAPVDNVIAGTVYFAASDGPSAGSAGGAAASSSLATNGTTSGSSDPSGVITLQTPLQAPASKPLSIQANQAAAPKAQVSPQNLIDNSVFEKAVQPKEGNLPQINTVLPQRSGATFGIGRAGRLYVVCQSARGPILTRGSVYTFYEVAGGPIKKEHWDRKLSFNLLRPPYWASRFDLVQDVEGQSSTVR